MQLSEVLQLAPHCFSSSRINASSRSCAVIDVLPAKYQTAQTVYISNNALASVEGVQQFSSVVNLSIANNKLTSFQDLQPLTACRTLQQLQCSGNPIACMPYYVQRVVVMLADAGLPLRSLDGMDITLPQDAVFARGALDAHTSMLALCAAQEVRILQLAALVKLMPVHSQLLQVVPTQMPRAATSPAASKLPMARTCDATSAAPSEACQVDILLRYVPE
ncbi:hypothetical protein EON66_09830 [archaeon]|nr:MAG: hypothetical protein EON66_09830 [archaeon]